MPATICPTSTSCKRGALGALAILWVAVCAALPAWGQGGTEPLAEPAQTVAGDQAGGTELADAEEVPRSPLSPAPTGSPRETLESFRTLSSDAASDLIEAFFEAGDEDGWLLFDAERVRTLKAHAINNLSRAMSTMDLSAVPPTNRRTVGINSVLLLEEILARIPLPASSTVPNAKDVEAGAAVNGWTIPSTQIQMIRSETLSGASRYLFSPDTVAQLPHYYALVRDLPRHSDRQIDFYQHFVSAPGLSMPVHMYRYILDLPKWTLSIYYQQAIWQWLAFGALTIIYGGLAYGLLRREAKRTAHSQSIAASIRRLMMPLLVIALLGVYRWLCDTVINLTGDVLTYLELVVETLQTFALAALVVSVFNFVAAVIVSSPRIRKESLDASLVRLIMRVLGFVAAGFIVFFGATRVGIPVYGIVAGLGVGGLAIALAVRPTLENFIGGIILYADRPVKVGDFCQFGSMLGTVEEIGLRSTKVRSLNRTLVTVQNSEFSQMSITNFSRRDANLMQTVIRLRHETTSQQLSAITDGIAQMLQADERVKAETVRICLLNIAESALEVEIWAYINSTDYTEFLKIKERLLLKVMDIVEEQGSAFAKPSQTTYLAQDDMPGGKQQLELAVQS